MGDVIYGDETDQANFEMAPKLYVTIYNWNLCSAGIMATSNGFVTVYPSRIVTNVRHNSIVRSNTHKQCRILFLITDWYYHTD